ncbi:MAG: ATP-binding protein [Chloroflexi bacterium]|nr:ATP-binding protein [Chloroflexota bacterium]
MVISNRDRVARVMDVLKEGLGPFVLREYKMVYRKNYGREIYEALATDRHTPPQEAFESEATLLEHVDSQGWLNLMWRRWNEVFRDKLGHAERSYVSELLEARNAWAHQRAFSNEEAYRVADTATLLLKAVTAGDQALAVQEIAQDLLRLRYEAQAKKSKKQTAPLDEQPSTTLPGLKPWRQVVQPHPDVASGRYMQAEFTADLSQVLAGKAAVEYQDPREFFRRTYLTEGLLALLSNGIRRLTAQGGDPVVQVQTAFGGGKTHSMLALYHLSGGEILKLSDIVGGERIAEEVGNIDPPEANRAVLVGQALNPADPRVYADCTTHTLWGELAYQLGGVEGYSMVENADLNGVSPGSDTLVDLLEGYGPCLVIIDELVAYARNLYHTENLPAGTFDAVMTFVQSLTEAVRRSSDSLLLISIPQSRIEIGGEGGQQTLEVLSHIVGRMEAVWRPVTAIESFEIVRRRLFATEIDFAARDAVLDAFADMYHKDRAEFPSAVSEREYFDRMRAAYPIHPELFDRLYQDWSTLDRFQRTRGVLRLMAAVIHELWARGDQSLLILPGTLPLDAAAVRNELLRYLPETWSGVTDADIDGPESRPFQIDNNVPTLGKYTASRRVARSIFIGSAPSVTAQSVRGVEEVRIKLASVQPGEPLAVFGDALKRMGNQLTYLYTDGSRYWYDTRPTVNRMARDRAQRFHEDIINQEIVARLKKVGKIRDFSASHVAPLSSSDVIDEIQARVVVLHPDHTHKRTNGNSPALVEAQHILEQRGNSPRIYRNMLVFIAPDQTATEALREAVRECLAWQSIRDDEDNLNLDRQQSRQVLTQLDRSDETVDARLMEAYNWLIVPWQSDPLGPLDWEAIRISGTDSFYERAARKLHKDGLLIPAWSPQNLHIELEQHLWNDHPYLGLKQLWEYFARYCYLPRLLDENVLLGAIRDGIRQLHDAPFGYATSVTEDGRYTGLVYCEAGVIYFDDQSVLVHPDVARQQRDEERAQAEQARIAAQTRAGSSEAMPDRSNDPSTVTEDEYEIAEVGLGPEYTRFYGAVSVDAQRVNREISLIVEEVIQRLTSLTGCDVDIHLEISAQRPEGFDEAMMRTISENSRTLKFDSFEFD